MLLALVGLVGNSAAFAAAVTALGAVHGSTDAMMNAYAVTVERRSKRPLLNGCHAAWSLSAILASALAAVVTRAGVASSTHLSVAAIALLAGARPEAAAG